MEISPQQVRTASFKVAKRGYEPNEVGAFLTGVADALEAAQNQATAMEARARAAVARLQELNARSTDSADVTIGASEAETISKTMLLAQRTADATIAEAQAEAERLLTSAREEAATTIASTREMSASLLEEAREQARRATVDERDKAEGEVQALLARRDFLEADVDHLEQFLVDQRERLRAAAAALLEISERVPDGLGSTPPPLLSAADASGDHERPPTPADVLDDVVELEDTGEIEAPEEVEGVEGAATDVDREELLPEETTEPDASESPSADEPTQLFEAVPRRRVDRDDETPPSVGTPPDSI